MTTTSESEWIAVGGPVDETQVTLTLRGADLDPAEITALLGLQPRKSHRRGDPASGTAPYSAGSWSYELKVMAPETAEEAIWRVLSRMHLSNDLWTDLQSRFDLSISVTMVVKSWNRGFGLTPSLVQELARRGIGLSFSLYAEPVPQTSACFA